MQIHPLVFRLEQLLRGRLVAGRYYLLAVSGGADSLALAQLCASLAQQGWLSCSVCHVEHGLRGAESLRDAGLVAAFCAERGLPCYIEHVQVAACAQAEHLSTEAAARRLRYEALWRVAAQVGADAIVTAHHLDDQAETLLWRLLRGAGLDGLAAMRERQGELLRPLLSVTRAELRQYCELQGLRYAEDSTNSDRSYTRNRIRHELLPKLERDYNPQLASTLAQTAQLLACDADYLQQQAQAAYERLAQLEPGSVRFSVDDLLQLPKALRSRVLREAYFSLGGAELSYERSEALELLCQRKRGGSRVQLPGGLSAELRRGYLTLRRAEPEQ